MARMDRRLRVWAWLVRQQASIAGKSEAEVLALQSRHAPSNAVTNYIFGAVARGVGVRDRVISGPGGDVPVRVYRPGRPGWAGPAAAGAQHSRRRVRVR